MLPKIYFVFNRRKKREVEAVVYYNRKRRYLVTGIKLPPGATFTNGVVAGCLDAPSMNGVLSGAMAMLQEQLKEQIASRRFDMGAFSLKLGHNTGSFAEWAYEQIEKERLTDGSCSCYGNAIAMFERHGIVGFADLTVVKIQRAVDLMCESLHPTTVRHYFMAFGKYVRRAESLDLIGRVPLDRVTLPRGKNREINYLTEEELRVVESAVCEGKLAIARDMFLLGCYTGLSYSDIVKINKDSIVWEGGKPYIIDNRKKTGGRYRLRMLPKAMAILERHNYRFEMRNNTANGYLQKLEKSLGLRKHLSMHVGRHTFATLALSKGVRIETVSRMLAHSDIKMTQIYAKVLQKDVDAGFDLLEDI